MCSIQTGSQKIRDDKTGTVFESPHAEPHYTHRADKKTISYGFNENLEFRHQHRRYNTLEQPGKTLFLGDASFSHNLWNSLNYRNNNQALVLYIDGHSELLSPEQVAAKTPSVFWRGD